MGGDGGCRALFWPHSPVSLGLSRNTWGEVATYVNTCVTHKHLPSLTSTSSVHPHWLCFWGPINILLYKDLSVKIKPNKTNQKYYLHYWASAYAEKTHYVYMRFLAYVDIRINHLQCAFFSVCQLKRICTYGEKNLHCQLWCTEPGWLCWTKKTFWYHLKLLNGSCNSILSSHAKILIILSLQI